MNRYFIIDPRSSFAYSSFYLYGLIQKYGYGHIQYSLKPFEKLGNMGSNMRFVCKDDGREMKIFIHTTDSYHILTDNYEWCDVYGCVNTNFEVYPQDKWGKIVSLAPSFGIAPYGISTALCYTTINFFKAFSKIIRKSEWNEKTKTNVVKPIQNIKHYFGRSLKTIKNRKNYSDYVFEESIESYVFFLSTLWYSNEDNNNDKEVNLRRAHFIRACKKVCKENSIVFEGGFADRSTSKSVDVFSDCMVPAISMDKWMWKTKKSAFVFNTPAFWNCHGWKLGEYLALGKCIISTKLINDLPTPLVHGVHIHYVEDTQEAIEDAIRYIVEHPEYRRKLENGARTWWEHYGTPEKSLELLGV